MNPYQNLKKVAVNNTEDVMKKLSPLGNKIILINMDNGFKLRNGLIHLDDSTLESGERGVRPRWAEVYAVGPEQTDVKVGDWVLMDHGRWSEGLKFRTSEDEEIKIWLGDPNGILGVSTTGKPAELQDV